MIASPVKPGSDPARWASIAAISTSRPTTSVTETEHGRRLAKAKPCRRVARDTSQRVDAISRQRCGSEQRRVVPCVFPRPTASLPTFRKLSGRAPERTPPFYPDAVTLSTAATVEAVLAGIDAGEGCSVKDSFACLELGDAGFRPLFRAEWVVGPAASGRVASPRGWSALTTEAGHRAWESSWGEVPGGSGFFRPALLLDNTIMVLARRESERVVAGAVANRSTTVVGLSNVFDIAGDLESAWAGRGVGCGIQVGRPTDRRLRPRSRTGSRSRCGFRERGRARRLDQLSGRRAEDSRHRDVGHREVDRAGGAREEGLLGRRDRRRSVE